MDYFFPSQVIWHPSQVGLIKSVSQLSVLSARWIRSTVEPRGESLSKERGVLIKEMILGNKEDPANRRNAPKWVIVLGMKSIMPFS